jgi:hypothetical protein
VWRCSVTVSSLFFDKSKHGFSSGVPPDVKVGFLALLCSAPLILNAQTYEDPGTRELPAHIGRTFLRLFHTDSIVPVLIGGAATGAAAVSKQEVASYFGQTRRFREFGQAGHIIGSPAVVAGAVGGLYIAGRRSGDPRFRAMTYSLAQANILTSAITMGAKVAVGRERPNQQARDSFFSGHSAAAFTTAAVLSEYYGPKTAAASYTVASLVALSRVEKNKHRLTDLTVGDDLLAPAFAVCREAGRRTLNMRHFDVQLIGGIVLHRGKIAEMKTGEGKTLVATLPAT